MENAIPLAVVTGASSGIGFQLAKQFVENGYDLLIVAEDAGLVEAAQALRVFGVFHRQQLQRNLAAQFGVERQIDLTHSANPQWGENLITVKTCSGRNWHAKENELHLQI